MSCGNLSMSARAIVVTLLLAGGVIAQTNPAQPVDNGAQGAPMDTGFRRSYYPETFIDYGTGFPAVEVRAVPPAMANAAIARAEFRRTQSALDLMVLDIRNAFVRTKEWVSAINEEKQAWDALEAARKVALKGVMDDPSYQASVALRQSISDQIEQLRGDKFVTKEQLHAMAQVKMGYAATASAMEAAALSASPEVQQARERLRRASAKLSELRFLLDQSVRLNPDVLQARRNMIDARITMVGASVYLEGVREARNIALTYAYWSRRNDIYKYLSYGHAGFWPSSSWGFGYPIDWR